MAILGCGLQGRKNLEALKAVLPTLAHCQAYDVVPEREAAFVREMNGRWGVAVVGAGSAEQAVRDADVVITAGRSRIPAARRLYRNGSRPAVLRSRSTTILMSRMRPSLQLISCYRRPRADGRCPAARA